MTRSRPTLGGRGSHDSPEAILGLETQSRLARGQPWVVTRPRPSLGGRRSHGSLEAIPERET
jgi:hypothetical protein